MHVESHQMVLGTSSLIYWLQPELRLHPWCSAFSRKSCLQPQAAEDAVSWIPSCFIVRGLKCSAAHAHDKCGSGKPHMDLMSQWRLGSGMHWCLQVQAGDRNSAQLVFCLGGPHGHSNAIRQRADDIISLSPLVLNHQVCPFDKSLAEGCVVRNRQWHQ